MSFTAEREVRPWGYFQILCKIGQAQVKLIEVKPGLRFSLQKHLKRHEMWTVLCGEGVVTVDGKESRVGPKSKIEVPLGSVHRMKNCSSTPLQFIEVQFGDYLGEDDIVRLEDDFGRI